MKIPLFMSLFDGVMEPNHHEGLLVEYMLVSVRLLSSLQDPFSLLLMPRYGTRIQMTEFMVGMKETTIMDSPPITTRIVPFLFFSHHFRCDPGFYFVYFGFHFTKSEDRAGRTLVMIEIMSV